MSRTEIVRFSKPTSFTMNFPITSHLSQVDTMFAVATNVYNQIKCAEYRMNSQTIFNITDQQVTDFYIFSFKHCASFYYNITRTQNKSRTKNVRFYNFVNQRGGMRSILPVTMFFTLIVQPDSVPITIYICSPVRGFINNKSPT